MIELKPVLWGRMCHVDDECFGNGLKSSRRGCREDRGDVVVVRRLQRHSCARIRRAGRFSVAAAMVLRSVGVIASGLCLCKEIVSKDRYEDGGQYSPGGSGRLVSIWPPSCLLASVAKADAKVRHGPFRIHLVVPILVRCILDASVDALEKAIRHFEFEHLPHAFERLRSRSWSSWPRLSLTRQRRARLGTFVPNRYASSRVLPAKARHSGHGEL